MSNLTLSEKYELETALRMGDGFVCRFSNRSFDEFVYESVGVNIRLDEYARHGESKANRLREFWRRQPNHVVARLLRDMHENWGHINDHTAPSESPAILQSVADRLLSDSEVSELAAALSVIGDEDFDGLTTAIVDAVDRGQPEAALDRLHTYLMHLFRDLCSKHDIDFGRETPLHSLAGAYAKKLDGDGKIESVTTMRILKSSISVLDSFNDVRNTRSYAHANELLSRHEGQLIVGHLVGIVRFVRAVESKFDEPWQGESGVITGDWPEDEELPF